jgi:TatD DNase family protein
MWIDTHCHLDAAEFDGQGEMIASRALSHNVASIVIPAVSSANFGAVQALAASQANCFYALGIHPLAIPQAQNADLETLRTAIIIAMDDPKFVAVGEIGLDFFVPELCTEALRFKQEHFYLQQLKIALEFDLPVVLHVRRAQDRVLKYLRQVGLKSGIAHAFNGSVQQANGFIDLGFKLGLGGAMTYPRALQIRRLAATMPLSALVLETDAPDIAPAWLMQGFNSPEQIPSIGACLATLRSMAPADIALSTSDNARCALPRLGKLA